VKLNHITAVQALALVDSSHSWLGGSVVKTAGSLQGLTVMQQCAYQIKFRNICEIKERLVQPRLV